MNFDKVKLHLERSEADPRFIKHMDEALKGMVEEGIHPYRLALELIGLSVRRQII